MGPQGRLPWLSRARSLGRLFGTLPRALLRAVGHRKDPQASDQEDCPEHNPGLLILCLGFLLCKMALHSCLPQNVLMGVEGGMGKQLCKLQISKQMQEMILKVDCPVVAWLWFLMYNSLSWT